MHNLKETTIKSYNKTASEYQKVVSSFELLPEINEFILKVNKGGEILDLGCGPGHHALFFSNNDFSVTGIDLSSEMIELAKKASVKSNFKIMDILTLDFQKASFDGIWASASLLHIPKNKITPVLQKLKEILIKDGILYISLKQGNGSELFTDIRYGGVDKYYVYYQLEEIENILKKIGFKILKIELKGKRTTYDTNSWIHIFCKNI
ncbi:2-polyprenyl-3-methyl-5-hydroxy-6-metoxy-1,4-benzoquinol methylase [Flavobacterium sp. 90]|uniref:class I SAM-dependent methyltransferase n=1 Tax=Flavobacterium sp. 90 TaxID=2135622 RepID=UPI00104EFF8E|nr:class I SAM-dependent methyltransferase [Flavobacterium sp. 90]TCK56472.1 2-polyprenyl-3-methyl-5-hydroxy-6-metoxy-1,4-benzoquinol methylase [Flavobacterium sp. 90]